MTTIVAVKKGGYVHMCADSQVTNDGIKELNKYVVPTYSKVFKVNNHIYIGSAGPAVTQQILASYFKTNKVKGLAGFKSSAEVFETFRKILARLKKAQGQITTDSDESSDVFQSDIIVITSDNIYTICSSGFVQEFNTFAAIGSGAPYALGALEVLYNTVDESAEIATTAVAAACQFDLYSSLPFMLYTTDLTR